MRKVVELLLIEKDNLYERDVLDFLNNANVVYKLSKLKAPEFLNVFVDGNANQKQLDADIMLIDFELAKSDEGINHFLKKELPSRPAVYFLLNSTNNKLSAKEVDELNGSGQLIKPFAISKSASSDIFHLVIDMLNIKN